MTAPVAAGYSKTQKILHWATLVVLLLQYTVFDHVGRAYHAWMDGKDGAWTTTLIAHMALGTLVLVLALARIALRRSHGAPLPPAEEPELFRKLAHWGHLGIYALLFALPLLGLGAWWLKIGAMAEVHEILTNALLALVIVHVGAVVVHQFHWKTNLIARMK